MSGDNTGHSQSNMCSGHNAHFVVSCPQLKNELVVCYNDKYKTITNSLKLGS